jgi:hypothetical protein
MDTTERHAWLNIEATVCDTYAPPTGKPESSGYCARCGMYDWRHAGPVSAGAARQVIADALRNLAPGHPAVRIWGRLAPPEQAQEGNAWAADPEDIADLMLRLIKQGTDLH